jgi:2-dehydro-3-deoxyphosphogluconate aldolase/(4S)-4-hydroxy-2-oxoglutarate aldolase
MSIGAGTVRSAEDVSRALGAGADFLVAPGFDPASVTRARDAGALLVPGVFTASEVLAALREGVPLVKLFPCEPAGPSYLKSLRAPLHDVEFVPTGGVTLENARSYFEAGAKALGAGSSLVAPGVSREEISARARRFLEIAAESRRE